MHDPHKVEIRWFVNPPDFNQWDELLEFLRDAYAYMDGRIDPPSSLHSFDGQALAAKAEDENLVLARSDSLLVACAFGRKANDTFYVGKVAVHECYRGQGLARGLFANLEEIARNCGCTHLELDTRVELGANRTTFEALGFAVVGDRAHPGFRRPTELIMQKDLRAE